MVGNTMNTDAASAHEVLDFLRARQVRRRWDATDWYMALFGPLMLGAALWTSLAGVRLPILSVSWGAVWVLGLGLLALGVARWNGPLAASAATTFWLLQAPLDRDELFTGSRRRALGWGAGSAVLGGVMLGLATMSWPVGVLAGFVMVAAVIVALRRQELLVRPLRRAQSRRDLVRGTLTSGDSGLAVDLLVRHRLDGTTPTRRLRPSGAGLTSLLTLESRRMRSRLRLWPAWAAVLLAGLATLAVPGVHVAVLGVACFALWLSSLGSVRMLASASGLARLFPQRGWRLRLALVTPHLLMALLLGGLLAVGVLVVSGARVSALAPLAVVLVALAAAIRWTSIQTPDHSTGIVMTESGPVPLGAMLTAARGADLLVIGLAVVASLPPVVGLCAAMGGLAWSAA